MAMHLAPLVQVASTTTTATSSAKDFSTLPHSRELPWPANGAATSPPHAHTHTTPPASFASTAIVATPITEPVRVLSSWISQPLLSNVTASQQDYTPTPIRRLHNPLCPSSPPSTTPLPQPLLSTKGTFPILELPGELRNKIYSSFIPEDSLLRLPLYLSSPTHRRTHHCSAAYSWKPIHPSILRVNSQIRHEVLGHFYERNTFEIHASSLARFLAPIDAQDRAGLRSLVLKGGFYMLDRHEEEDESLPLLLSSLNLTRLHIYATVSLWDSEAKRNVEPERIGVEEFVRRSGLGFLRGVRGLAVAIVSLEGSFMTRKGSDLEGWLREVEDYLEEGMVRPRAEGEEEVNEVAEVEMDVDSGVDSGVEMELDTDTEKAIATDSQPEMELF